MKDVLLSRFVFVLLLLFSISSAAEEKQVIKCGWYHWDPYQFVNGSGNLVGLDVALIKTIFEASDIEVEYDEDAEDSWKKNQDDVYTGVKQIAAGAFQTPDREAKYHLTRAYRYEWNSLYVRTEDARLKFNSISDMIQFVEKNKKYRLGVIQGYKYTSNELNNYIAQSIAKGSDRLVTSVTEEENFERLSDGKVRFVVSDRLVGARILWKNDLGGKIVEHPLKLPALPIHVLIHKNADPEIDKRMRELVEAFNRGLDKLETNGKIDKIVGNYLFPVLMNITVQRDWFYLIDILGAVFFSIAGLLIAKDHRYDIFGTIVMVALLATGGGLMRDLLVGRMPVVLRSPDYVYIVALISFGGFFLLSLHARIAQESQRYYAFFERAALFFNLRKFIEAVALGAYTIIGVGVAVEMKVSPLWLWGPILGCLTSCGGGVLAAALRKGDDATNMRGGLDPECSLVWGAFFSFFLVWQTDRLNPDEVLLGVLVTLSGTALTLIVLNQLKVKSPCIAPISRKRALTENEGEC